MYIYIYMFVYIYDFSFTNIVWRLAHKQGVRGRP